MTFHMLADAVVVFGLVFYWLLTRFYRRRWNSELDEHLDTLREREADLKKYKAWKDHLCGDSAFYIIFERDGEEHRREWQPANTETANEWPEEIR